MKTRKSLLLPILMIPAALLFMQCESPKSPDFSLSQKIDAPLIAESNFQFLGGSNALIDTTSENLQDLFVVDGDQVVTLVRQESFEFGDLEDVVPELQIDPVTFQTEIGEIIIVDFSSQDEDGNLGSAGFQDLTGTGLAPQEGDNIPAAQSPAPVSIPLDTDYFESATIRDGSLELTLRNELGFDIDEMNMELFSGATSVGSLQFSGFFHQTVRSGEIVIVENPGTDPEVVLEDLSVTVEISWQEQTMQDDAGELIVNDLQGRSLIASEIRAQIPSQQFEMSDSFDFSDDEFRFESTAHYTEFSSGTITIEDLISTIDVDIESMVISFPEIRRGPSFGEGDSLVIEFSGENAIPRNNSTPLSRIIDLSGTRLYAQDNRIDYNIFAITENTQDSEGSIRTIRETDGIEATISIGDLQISEAFGVTARRQLFLNNNDTSTPGFIDLMNDAEAELIEIDGLADLSSRVSGIEFTRASLNLNYTTNIDIPVDITAAFMGTDADGNRFFLQGIGDNAVTDFQPADQLRIDGSMIPTEELIRFRIDNSDSGSVIFDNENSAINEFFNRIPVEIRFIGVAVVNDQETEGTVRLPFIFEPDLEVNVPLAMRADNAAYTDTTSRDLSNLPAPDDNSQIEEGSLIIQYFNNIPLGFSLQLEFLDEDGSSLTNLPLPGQPEFQFDAAGVDAAGISSQTTAGTSTLTLSRTQLDLLHLTRDIRISALIQSTDGDEVRIRETDDVTISISGSFKIQNRVN
jgi:hypothetical protein